MNLQEITTKKYGRPIAQCTNEELYYSLLCMTKEMAKAKLAQVKGKIVDAKDAVVDKANAQILKDL